MDHKRYLILVSQPWGSRLANTYRRLTAAGAEVRAVAFGTEAREALARAGIASEEVDHYADRPDEFDLTRKAVVELNDFTRRKVGDRALGDWLAHGDLPLWPFISPNLYADVNAQAKTLTILDKICEREKPDCIVAQDTDSLPPLWYYLRGLSKEPLLVDRLAVEVARGRSIEWLGIKTPMGRRLRHRATSWCGRLFVALRGGVWLTVVAALIRRLLAGWARFRGRHLPTGGVLLFSHRKYWRREFNPVAGRAAMTDTAIYPVAKALLDAGEKVRCLDGNYGFVGGLRELRQKLFTGGELAWGTFDTWYPLGRVWGLRRAANAALGALAHREDLANLFSYGKYRTGGLFLPRLHFLLADYLWKSALWIEAGRLMVTAMRPEAVALTYETGTLSRAIINACRERGIPSIGMQHGAFSDVTDDYMRTEHTHIRHYVPDCTAIWGERFRRVLLEQSAYAADEVAITGNPRMDFLVGAQSLLDADQVYQKYGLDPGRRLVLAAPTETIGRTQHLAKDRFFDGIVDAAKARPATQWVVKLKPGAESEAYYRARLEKLGGADVVLTEDDLYALLVAADAVVTPPSSIAIEALLMRKPVVYTAFADAEDYFPHLSECGAVFTRRDMVGLADEIEAICRDHPQGLLDEAGLEELVYEENYKPDGKAAERVVELIQSLKTRSAAATAQPAEGKMQIERTAC